MGKEKAHVSLVVIGHVDAGKLQAAKYAGKRARIAGDLDENATFLTAHSAIAPKRTMRQASPPPRAT